MWFCLCLASTWKFDVLDQRAQDAAQQVVSLGVTTSIPAGALGSQQPSWDSVSGGLHGVIPSCRLCLCCSLSGSAMKAAFLAANSLFMSDRTFISMLYITKHMVPTSLLRCIFYRLMTEYTESFTSPNMLATASLGSCSQIQNEDLDHVTISGFGASILWLFTEKVNPLHTAADYHHVQSARGHSL